MADIELAPLPPREAIRFFESKGYQIGFSWQDVWQQEHARAFTVAKAMRLDILETIRQELDAAMKEGKTLRQFQKELKLRLEKLGWWGRREETDPKTGKRRVVQLGSPRRLRTIYDVNMRTAHSAGRWARAERVKEARPYLMYVAVLDDRTRPEHRSWHHIVLPVDHPFWDTHYPPNGWNCRCIVRQLDQAGLDRRGLKVSGEKDLEPFRRTRTFRNKRTGEEIEVPEGIDPGFAYNVGKEHMRGAREALAAAEKRARDTLSGR